MPMKVVAFDPAVAVKPSVSPRENAQTRYACFQLGNSACFGARFANYARFQAVCVFSIAIWVIVIALACDNLPPEPNRRTEFSSTWI